MKTLLNKSVLIIDDNPGMLRALEKVLGHAGLKVTRATWVNGEVQELKDRKHFDLVITDLRMPEVSGLTILQGMQVSHPGVPVIIITAYGSPDKTPAWWKKHGAAAYLEKPINEAHLLSALERVFDAR